MIEWVFNSSRGTYGYRRVHAALARRGVETSPEAVRSIMRAQGLEAAQPRRKDRAPLSRPPGPGLVPRPGPAELHRQQAGSEVGGRHPPVSAPGRDSICLATVPGCCTKKAVGYAMADSTRHRS